MKTCSKCHNSKSYSEFYKNRARHDGYCNLCKQCDKNKPINKQGKKIYNTLYRQENSEKIAEYQSQYYVERKEKYSERNRHWIENNKERWQFLGRRNAQTETTKKRHRFQEAKRRAKKFNATPAWVNIQKIKVIYENCPVGYHVDHIIPLNHPLICGLHVPWNLQYLPALENIRKNNKVEGLNVQSQS